MPTETLRPNADGYSSGWTPLGGGDHYVEVDEVVPDEDTSYIYLDVDAYTIENFFLTDFTGVGVINSITLYARCKRVDAADCLCHFQMWSGAWYYGDWFYPTTAYVNYSWYLETNPFTGSAWTDAELDALVLGLEGKRGAASGQLRCTTLWVVVDYTEVVGHSFGAIID